MTIIGVVDRKDRAARIVREYLSAAGHSVAYLSGAHPLSSAMLTHLQCEYLVIYMDRDFCPLPFDILLLCAPPKNYTLPKPLKARLVLTSADDFDPPDNSVAFGMGSGASVTASSIETEADRLQFTCCVRREFPMLGGDMTLPGETPVCIQGMRIPIGAGLAGLTVLLALGLFPEERVKILL
ncbi:MAG: hypothetical protein E7409_03920 [Ruminococcaceae bacterium]|nr:hypothetical protein [Oscillospiraceae bacterium]